MKATSGLCKGAAEIDMPTLIIIMSKTQPMVLAIPMVQDKENRQKGS